MEQEGLVPFLPAQRGHMDPVGAYRGADAAEGIHQGHPGLADGLEIVPGTGDPAVHGHIGHLSVGDRLQMDGGIGADLQQAFHDVDIALGGGIGV